MQLDNVTDWAAALTPGWGIDRKMQMTCTIKISYQWDDQGMLHPLTESDCPITMADEYRGDDPTTGSVLAPSDTAPFKNGFEWVLIGSVPEKKGITHHPMTVVFHEGSNITEKTVYAIGERYWKKSLFGVVPSKPETLKPHSLSYEHAFGGFHEKDNGKIVHYPLNPVGKGFYKTRDKEANCLLPSLEQKPFITSTKDRPKPAGFGAIGMAWSPRIELFQKLDADAAAEGQCPYPSNVPSNLYNSAPEDQQLKSRLSKACIVTLTGFYDSSLQINLPYPDDQVRLICSDAHGIKKLKPQCDTLILDTDKKTLSLVYRTGIPFDPMQSSMTQILLDAHDVAEAVVND
jgi:hypothetical protein